MYKQKDEHVEEKAQALSVSDAMSLAKGALESVVVRVIGEVSELSVNPRYKAVYFTIKDENASLPCMMWNNRFEACGISLDIGSLVELTGRFSLYAAKGRMNFDVFSIELAGEGRLRLQVARLAEKLKSEGLMDSSKKKPIPKMPSCIGVVSSPQGAAIHDVLRTLHRRYPIASVSFCGVHVEGKSAPKELIEALSVLDNSDVDVVLLVRGGGSFEDLMPFNDEDLARKISEMKKPVITGIGHEPDTSIADMVSDLRASTPTAAAEAASPSAADIASVLDNIFIRMSSSVRSTIVHYKNELSMYSKSAVLSEPGASLKQVAIGLDDLTRRMVSFSKVMLLPYSQKVSMQAAKLEALSPLSVLSRGYSISRDDNGNILRSVNAVSEGDNISVQLQGGYLNCNVEKVKKVELAMEDING